MHRTRCRRTHRTQTRSSQRHEAAYEVALNQYPKQSTQWQQLLDRTAPASGAAQQRSVDLGKAAAAAVLDSRKDDQWDQQAEYRFHPMGPGVYAEFREHSGTPQGFVFGTGWGDRQAVRVDARGSVSRPPAAGHRQSRVHGGVRRSEGRRRASRAVRARPIKRIWRCGGKSSSTLRTTASLATS